MATVTGDYALASAFAGPLYLQVAAMLRAKICASEWTPRSTIPNEVALARDVGVSIGTMRKALEVLESERLIDRRQGRGTFVIETSTDTEVERFSKLSLLGKKLKAERVDWSCEEAVAERKEAQRLNIATASPVYRLEALWRADRGAAVIECVTVAASRFPDLPEMLADAGQFLFPLYRLRHNIVVARVVETVRCRSCDADAAGKLKTPTGTPVLQIERVAYDLGGHAVELAQRTVLLGEAAYCVAMR